jgi:hypothetical protein
MSMESEPFFTGKMVLSTDWNPFLRGKKQWFCPQSEPFETRGVLYYSNRYCILLEKNDSPVQRNVGVMSQSLCSSD